MLFEAIERKIFSSMTEKNEFGEKLTVEHIMPKKWHTYWPLPEGVQTDLWRQSSPTKRS